MTEEGSSGFPSSLGMEGYNSDLDSEVAYIFNEAHKLFPLNCSKKRKAEKIPSPTLQTKRQFRTNNSTLGRDFPSMLDLQESPDTRQADEVVQPSSKGTTTLSATMGTSKDRNHQRPSFLGSRSTVTVNVSCDDGKDTFQVHKDFICFYSPYFRAALNSSLKEGTEQFVDLEDIRPEPFSLF
ncbi:POZ [Glarea lozoyensis ATCC 20868]|uniref:POZ n=1 Tax=Glarea lozoyensis (strain ATCC 20868 / MF5171) TaxID=1116229 RepID=S3CNA1_GLAL2|nr:POZ [Glarea lozoyensis ATCC 20868]EPE26664.1 POZ [Glarea lozoyensis ATCC 20868]